VPLVILGYPIIGGVLQRWGSRSDDALMATIDRLLFLGLDPVSALQSWINRPLSEWLAFCYSFYVPLFPITMGVFYALAPRSAFSELVFSLTTTLAVGYVAYTFVPVQGPMFTQHFSVSLDSYYLEGIKAQLIDRYRIDRDCFPSLHTAIYLVCSLAAWRHVRRYFWLLLPIAASVPLACLYFRYHYAIDVLAGAALALAVSGLARFLFTRSEALAPPETNDG
jgi:membrane-associated phospholipid phosphatase